MAKERVVMKRKYKNKRHVWGNLGHTWNLFLRNVLGCQVTHSSSVAPATSSWYEWMVVDVGWTYSRASQTETMMPQFDFLSICMLTKKCWKLFQVEKMMIINVQMRSSWGDTGPRHRGRVCLPGKWSTSVVMHSLAGRMEDIYVPTFGFTICLSVHRQREGNTSHTSTEAAPWLIGPVKVCKNKCILRV